MFSPSFFILHSAFCISSSGAAPAQAALDRFASGLNRFVMDNGLTVLTLDDASAPVVSIQIWVGVGSVHEQEYLGGGLSHLVEHMLFKGTPTRKPGTISRAVNDLGGSINAYTSLDRTVFLVDVPSAHWQTCLAVLADAVMNASFPDDEWQREKDVILREMAMCKDSPEREISELLWQTAYTTHPYRYPVIGYDAIFKTLTRADLLAFFRRHYAPNNMILSIVGDVRPADARAEAQKQFGSYPRRAYSPAVLPTEPEQIGRRTARKTGDYTVARLEWAWHTVALSHPDAPALDLLANIVGRGRSSRLVNEIQETKKLATQIEAWSFTPRNAGLFGISAVFDPANEKALEQALETETASWTNTPFRPDEIEKARRQMLADTLSAFQTMHGQADQFASGEYYAGTPFFFDIYLRRLNSVTPESLADAARRYLTDSNLTRVALVPEKTDDGRRTTEGKKGEGEANAKRTTHNAQFTMAADEGQTAAGEQKSKRPTSNEGKDREPNVELRTRNTCQKTILSNGLVLLTREDHKLPFVEFRIVCGGGLLFENETNNGISSLMTELLPRGTTRRSAREIAAKAESRGGNLSAFAGQNSFGLKARCLQDDTELFMDLLADCLLNPVFAPEEIEKQKSIQLAAIKQQRESPMFLAQEVLRQTLFAGHPYRFSPEGASATVQALSRQALRDYHAKTVVSGNTVLAIFGAIESDDARALAERFMRRLTAGMRPATEHGAAKPNLPQQICRNIPKEQTVILIGVPGIDLKDPRRDALDILQEAMNGLSSGLMTRIRDEQGQAYYTGVMERPGLEPGFIALYAGTHTSAVSQVQGLMQAEIQRVTTQGLRAEEFERARAQLIADYQQSLQMTGDLALTCALNELYGLGYEYFFTQEKRLQSLTAEDVRKAAASLLIPEKTAGIIVMPETK